MSTPNVSTQDEAIETVETVEHSENGRRALFRKAAIIGGAAIAGGSLLSKNASAADTNPVLVGGNLTATNPTEIYYDGVTDFPAGPSVISGGEDASPLQGLFTAGVGGYGVEQVANGVHGSTMVPAGYGVVAANGFTPVTGTAAPKALALGSLGSHVQFLRPADVATAAGLTYPAQVGPSPGTHGPGEMVVDDEYNLWFSVPGAATADPIRWIKLAGRQTAGSFVPLPVAERILDTRVNSGTKVPNNATVQVDVKKKVGGTADSSLALGATAVLLNLTLDGTEGSGFHRAYSADATLDPASPFSSINWDGANQIRANLSVVAIGRATPATAGAIKVTSGGGGSTHLIIDLLGYYL